MATKKDSSGSISIMKLETNEIAFCIKGTTPFIYNAMSAKSKGDLLLPPKKNRAEQQATLKHNPIEEYRASVYRHRSNKEPTRLIVPSGMFKGALASAALDIPGATMTSIKRLTWVKNSYVDMYGVPELFMSVVKNSGFNRTPDIRTRAILPEWACIVKIQFARPAIDAQSVINLLAAAGVIIGVGDFRQEKGKGNYGQFELVGDDDAEFRRILKCGGRVAQDQALDRPIYWDIETEELFRWYEGELVRRKGAAEARPIVRGRKVTNGGAGHAQAN